MHCRQSTFLLPLSLVVLLLGCGGGPASPSPRAKLVPSSEVTARVVPRGGTSVVTFRVENQGSAPITLTTSDACRIRTVITEHPSGRTVYPTSPGACATVITSVTLEPGESEWSTVQVKAADSAPFLWVPLPPGEYDVRATLTTLDTVLRWEPERIVIQ